MNEEEVAVLIPLVGRTVTRFAACDDSCDDEIGANDGMDGYVC
jgi:hypothetical protein